MATVVGLDLSLTGTGLARYRGGAFDAVLHLNTKPPKSEGHERLDYILGEVRWITDRADLVVIEGLSFQFDAERANAGLAWLVRHQLWEDGVPYALMPPANRSQYATGSGKATKTEVIEAVNSDLFPGAQTKNNDEADAIVLAAAGLRQYGQPVDNVPEENWIALKKGKWPDITLPI